jgi:hypothetical protein
MPGALTFRDIEKRDFRRLVSGKSRLQTFNRIGVAPAQQEAGDASITGFCEFV